MNSPARILVRRLRYRLETVTGKNVWIRKDVNIGKALYGSVYGSWCIPLEFLTRDSIVYSAGVGEDTSFDEAIISRYGVTVHAFDPTPKSIEWVGSQALPKQFHFHPYGLSDTDGILPFKEPENPAYASYRVVSGSDPSSSTSLYLQVRKLQSIMTELNHHQVDLLKMDIEGSEYAVIDSLEESAVRPSCVLVEFHHRQDRLNVKKTKAAIHRLRGLGYNVFWVSDTGSEIGFVMRPR